MKATQRDFARIAPRAAQACRIFFFCGPDEAGASAAADKLLALMDDPGERVELAGAQLRKDPALLGDEARSASLFGGKRHVYVRAIGDEAHDALAALIETARAGAGEAAPVVVVAANATDKARSARLLEKRDDALVAMFWPPDLASVTQEVRMMADGAGLRLDGDLAQRIARACALDVRLARSEIEKLATYCDASPQSPRPVSPEDLDAVGAVREEDSFAPLVDAVMLGDQRRLGPELARLRELSPSPLGVLLALERRAALLARVAAQVGPRGGLDRLDRAQKARLGIFFREERQIAAQLGRWNRAKLERLGQRLIEMHRELIENSQSAEVLLAQGLAQIARFAAR